MDDNEKLEINSDEGSIVGEDWNEPELDEVPEWTKPDKPMTMETRRGGNRKTSMRYNRYRDDCLIDKIKPDETGADLVSVSDLVSDQEWQIINKKKHS